MGLDTSSVKHHPALDEIVGVLCTKSGAADRSFFQVMVAYYLAKMAASMRATIVTKDRGEIPVNQYVLALATSGFGKGLSVGVVEHEFIKGFEKRFMRETFPVLVEQNLWIIANERSARNGTDLQEEFDKAQKEFRDCGASPFSFDSGTAPAVKQLRQRLLLAGAGSVNFEMDEIGSNLTGNVEVLNLFLELYDQGRVKQKLIKHGADNKRTEEVDGKTPTNMLLFGVPSKLFDGSETEENFYSFLETGYARRCLYGFGHKSPVDKKVTPEERFRKLTQPADQALIVKWSTHFLTLADPAYANWKMVVEDNVGIALTAYQIECEKQAEEMPEHEDIRKAEMTHRYWKALKLAGTYAFIDQSTEIEMEHLEAAIKLVEESGDAFQMILNREKAYQKLAKYIAAIGTEVTHADLHEALPFYKSSPSQRNDLMNLATAWGYTRHIIVKKTFVDGIEFFKGETLQETDLKKMVVSYSEHWAYNYLAEEVPFDKLAVVTQAPGFHWANHHFQGGHRAEENVRAGFNMIAIDVDGTIGLETVHDLMKDYKFLTYTTKRHTEEENRFRLIMPTNYHLELDQEEYREFMNCIMAWLPFETDVSANQRAKKWESFGGGSFHYNLEAQLLDVLPFIPKTKRNEQYRLQNQQLESLDNLERWFAQRIATGNRNNHMIRYALTLVDSGWSLVDVRNQVMAFNDKLSNPLSEQELVSTVLVTVAKQYQQKP